MIFLFSRLSLLLVGIAIVAGAGIFVAGSLDEVGYGRDGDAVEQRRGDSTGDSRRSDAAERRSDRAEDVRRRRDDAERRRDDRKDDARDGDATEDARSGVEQSLHDLRADLPGAFAVAAGAAVVPLIGLAVALLFLGTTRWASRNSRRYVRLWLIPYRSDQADLEQVRRMMESWHQQLLQRWWRRALHGQPSMALEVMMARDAEGDLTARLAIVCPQRLVSSVEGSLLSCYPDSRLVRGPQGLPPISRVIRLKKRHHFVRALHSDEAEERTLVDSVLRQMASLQSTAVIQYALTPTPAIFDRYSRWRFSERERASEGARRRDPASPGLRSEVLLQELHGGLRVQHRPLFFADIRVAAESYRDAAAIAGAIRGESGAENRLVERYMRPGGRGSVYLTRMRAGTGNLLPAWRRGVLSSNEMATLWELPSPGLKGVRVARTAVPRIPAPPEISRKSEHALARDDRGLVGIRPEDKTDGLGLIGGQKTGKTSLLCRTVQADGLDEDCAMVVLMPKPGDAEKALSMIPQGRTVHYLDLEMPEFGINPLTAPGDPGMVADRIVDAFRDVNAEGDIRGSSDRYLRQAAQAAIGASRAGVIDGPPTLWHMYRILIPVERAFREKIVESLYLDPRFTDSATFFGRELPGDLEASPGQTAAKLDAPRNKLLRLLVESLDKVLRHPIQLSMDDVVRRKEVLVVDGKMGTFGADNCRVMMQFILNTLYGVLQRQQQLPEEKRVRVALKVDEAHLILNESFADALATLRSGGLEVVAAWQYGDQIQDPKIRSGMMSLLRQRCMFSMGESQDARDMTSIAMSAYSDMIRPDAEHRALLRITPDVIFNLPNFHTICSWISRGGRAQAFVAKTLPLETNDEVLRHHREAQQERGCYVPDRLSDPMPDLDWKGLRELPSEPIIEEPVNGAARASNGVAAPNGNARVSAGGAAKNGGSSAVDVTTNGHDPVARAAGVALDFDPAATSIYRADERPRRPVQSLPESITELDLDDVSGLIWDKVTPLPADRRQEPTQRELEILAALWSYRFLFASQIHRRWWRGSSLRAAQQTLNRMAKSGWVRRFKFQLGERGAQQRVYCLTRLGFDLAQERIGQHGSHIDPANKWREPMVSDARRILRSLHMNGWVLAFEHRAGRVMRTWRGPRDGRLEPPRRRVRNEWIDLDPRQVIVGASHKLRDYEPYKFEPVSPDATLELHIPMGDDRLRFDLLVEMARGGSAASVEDRMRRYDGLISGWSGMLDRYKALGTPPVVVFVCEDEPSVMNMIRIADRAVTARLAKSGAEETEWPHPARRGMFFVAEREIHLESLEAFQLPDHPPDLRVRLGGRKQSACHPKRVHLIEPRLLDRT